MIIEMNVQYTVKPGKEKLVLDIFKDLRSTDTGISHEILRNELLWSEHCVEEKDSECGIDDQDSVSKVRAFLETPARVRVHFRA